MTAPQPPNARMLKHKTSRYKTLFRKTTPHRLWTPKEVIYYNTIILATQQGCLAVVLQKPDELALHGEPGGIFGKIFMVVGIVYGLVGAGAGQVLGRALPIDMIVGAGNDVEMTHLMDEGAAL